MKLVMLCLLSAMAVLCFGYFLLGLLHLESLFLSGILFFTLIFLIFACSRGIRNAAAEWLVAYKKNQAVLGPLSPAMCDGFVSFRC
ncbi:hypothetical protein NBRC111894_1425 [Sporolactobacillus inulinus]|uniref:Uncharacterized protein n=1 Tax=Sporolactobacillus inulinus TaxID=2078 RepID=A0A4Y1ZAD6_9BACL|nr:hypothetical protein NBRC111894_1425 [Sporolactobacillus inulinus]